MKTPALGEPLNNEDEKQKAIKTWSLFMLMAAFRVEVLPNIIGICGLGSRVYVKAVWEFKDGSLTRGVVIHNAEGFNFSLNSKIEPVEDGFGEDWPPYERARRYDKEEEENRSRIILATGRGFSITKKKTIQ